MVDAEGTLLFAFGDPFRATLARSAAKPAQALAILETGAADRYGFDAADLALMCGSNSSEDRHVARARAMLAKSGSTEDEMRCGGHPPLSEAVHRAWIRSGFRPTPACSNCAGKHAGMLAAARAIGAPVADYHEADHPLQQRVRRTMAAVCDLPDDGVAWAIDGCNLPTPGVPLDRLARLYATLADDPGRSGRDGADPARSAALARLYDAMVAHPEMVAGEGRFCTRLMRAYAGTLVGKVGADASYAIGIRPSDDTRRLGAVGAVGLAVKVEDGTTPVLHALVAALLDQLAIGEPAARSALDGFRMAEVRNTVGTVTGRLEVTLRLERPRGSPAA